MLDLRRRGALVGVVLVAAVGLSGCASGGSLPTSISVPLGLPGASRLTIGDPHYIEPSAELSALARWVSTDLPTATPMWRPVAGNLEIWLDPDTDLSALNAALATIGADADKVLVFTRTHSIAEIEAAMSHLHDSPYFANRRIVTAYPRYDGSGINVSVVGSVGTGSNAPVTELDGIPVYVVPAWQEPLTPLSSVQ